MLTKFIEGLGSKLAEQWVVALLTPAFLFWASGFGIWAYHYGWGRFIQRFAALSPPTKILVLIVGLIVVAVSALIVRRLEAPVLRLLEGYWPRVRPIKWLRRKLVGRKIDRIESMKNQWGALKVKEASGSLTSEETEELRDLEWKLHYVPSAPEQYMP